jgi:hypothetical protein
MKKKANERKKGITAEIAKFKIKRRRTKLHQKKERRRIVNSEKNNI